MHWRCSRFSSFRDVGCNRSHPPGPARFSSGCVGEGGARMMSAEVCDDVIVRLRRKRCDDRRACGLKAPETTAPAAAQATALLWMISIGRPLRAAAMRLHA